MEFYLADKLVIKHSGLYYYFFSRHDVMSLEEDICFEVGGVLVK